MAYPHTKYEVYLTGAAGTSANMNLAGAAADKFYWSPGYMSHIIRAVALIITTATVGTAGVLDFDKRITAGSDTGRISNGGVARLNVPAKAAGTVIFSGAQGATSDSSPLNVRIDPGQ